MPSAPAGQPRNAHTNKQAQLTVMIKQKQMHKPSNVTGGKNVNKTLHNVNSTTKEMDKQTVTTQRNQKTVTMHSGPSTHQVPGPAKRNLASY